MSEAMYCRYEDLLVQVDEGDLLQQADMSAPPPLYHDLEEESKDAAEMPEDDNAAEEETGEAEDTEDTGDAEEGVMLHGDVDDEEADDEEENTVVERDNITPAIVNASAEIAGYIARRYKLPDAPSEAPAMLRKLCADIAIFNVYSRKGFQFASDKEDMIVYERYKNAIEYLKAVADEKLDIDGLGDSTGEDGDEEGDGDINYGSAHIWLHRS